MMEYLGSAELKNYGTNCFHTKGSTSEARTHIVIVWKISLKKGWAPVSTILTPFTPLYSKYQKGVSTFWEKGGRYLQDRAKG